MRPEWYGDKRDIIKWSSVLDLAKKCEAKTILQVPMCSKGPEVIVCRDGTKLDSRVIEKVLEHFNDLAKIRNLGEPNIKIKVFDEPFLNGKRQLYFDVLRKKICNTIKGSGKVPIIVLLDPDTGIAPKKAKPEHVTKGNLLSVFEVLRPGDYLACYQHSPRRKFWQTPAHEKFYKAINVDSRQVETFKSQYATNVIILAAKKQCDWCPPAGC